MNPREGTTGPEDPHDQLESRSGLQPPPWLPEERPEEYLGRATNLLYKNKYGENARLFFEKGANIQDTPENQQFMDAVIDRVRERAGLPKEKFSKEKNQKTVETVERVLATASNKGKEGDDPYAHTNRTRTFHGRANSTDNIPYSHSLFGVGSNSPKARDYLKSLTKDKTVYLLGGGDSVEDLISSHLEAPARVVNIDPYLQSESVLKGKKGNYESFGVKAEDSLGVRAALGQKQIPKADEIWASYSVPFYLDSSEQIRGLFSTIRQSLAENGVARITPIVMQEGAFPVGKAEFMQQIRDLADSPEFNVYVAESPAGATLFIERISKRHNVDDDQERISELRAQLGNAE